VKIRKKNHVGKKRKRDENGVDAKNVSNVEDVQDYLVSLSCKEFDEFVGVMSKSRSLTSEESNLIKDIRRRIKNRESARKCRQNRRNKLETLEDKIKGLSEETQKLQQSIASLKMEGQCVQEDVSYLKGIINCNPMLSSVFEEYQKAKEDDRDDVLKSAINKHFLKIKI